MLPFWNKRPLSDEDPNAVQKDSLDESIEREWEKLSLTEEDLSGHLLVTSEYDCPGYSNSSSVTNKTAQSHRKSHQNKRSQKVVIADVYRQFVLDIPRLDISFDGKPWTGHPTLLFMELWSSFSTKSKAIRIISLFTQSELAPWFQMGRQMWVTSEDEHFLDGGRQKVSVVTQASPHLFSAKRTFSELTISKPFRVVDFHKQECMVRFTVALVVTYNLLDDTMIHSWTRAPGPPDRFCCQDWTIIESASGPEKVFHTISP